MRAAHRCLPEPVARAFVGRLMADPSFLAKLALEQTITLAAGTAYEAAVRGPRLAEEADSAAVSVGGQLVANAATVWLLAPSRTFGGAAGAGGVDWRAAMGALPNHVFDASGPLRKYTLASRAAGALAKSSQLAALGLCVGGISAAAQQALSAHKRRQDPGYGTGAPPSPPVAHQALGSAAWLGLSCGLRYNLIAGAERWAAERLSSLSAAALFTVGARLLNNAVGEAGRLKLMGLPSGDGGSAARVGAAISGWPSSTGSASADAAQGRGAAQQQAAQGRAHGAPSAEELALLRRRRAQRAAQARAPPSPAAGSGFSVQAKAVAAKPQVRRAGA